MKIGLVSAIAVAAFVLAPTAFAQAPSPAGVRPGAAAAPAAVTTGDYTEERTGGDQVVIFTGDPLHGDENSAYGFALLRPPGVLRRGLLRPRVNFVSELLKSVENL